MTYVMYFTLHRGMWVRMARKACWLANCKIGTDVVGHPGFSGILHFTYYVLDHTKSFPGILSSRVVYVLNAAFTSSSMASLVTLVFELCSVYAQHQNKS